VVRETALGLLREHQLAFERDLELTAASADERRVEVTGLLERGRQTGGPGKVVSLDAVADLERHGFLRWGGIARHRG